MNYGIVAKCMECGKRLSDDESETGFCTDCNAKVENDIRILSEPGDNSFAFLADIAV